MRAEGPEFGAEVLGDAFEQSAVVPPGAQTIEDAFQVNAVVDVLRPIDLGVGETVHGRPGLVLAPLRR